ncbi:MAG: Asp-tRNA(Asn)/Glu-tRNA(Gln) amidotransferase subunit GatB [Thermotogae bacterium]|nr:Asp-tRNA(Asn)/Glu-tRNA(Gln) amidotransferase subunit GatB [Thermotogota bacterium]
MRFHPTIGLEVHVELKTVSKMFCSCPVGEWDEPNVAVCPVCMGHPGTLPVPNRRAVLFAVALGLALKGRIARTSHFYRKNYFYPDLPKGYQITQYSVPIVQDARLLGVQIERINLEEETAKSLHTETGHVLLDFNRAGVPLLEIVSAPEIRSSQQAKEYLVALQSVVRFLGISDAHMEKGQLRVDVNVSLSPDSQILGNKVEVKNLNSFKAVADAIEYEIKRQRTILERGERVIQETRMWNGKGTEPMRTKETASDYRFFPDPDLPPLVLTDSLIEEAKGLLVELPWERQFRYEEEGVPSHLAKVLAYDPELTRIYEDVMEIDPKLMADLILNVILGKFSKLSKSLSDFDWKGFKVFVKTFKEGNFTREYLKEGIDRHLAEGVSFERLLKEAPQMEEIDVEPFLRELIVSKPQEVKKFAKGQRGVVGFFVGQVMRKYRGKVDPRKVRELTERLLEEAVENT